MKRQCGNHIDHTIIKLPLNLFFFFLGTRMLPFWLFHIPSHFGSCKVLWSSSKWLKKRSNMLMQILAPWWLIFLLCISLLPCFQFPEKTFATFFPGCSTNASKINNLLNLSMHACEKWLKLCISLLHFSECQLCTILHSRILQT